MPIPALPPVSIPPSPPSGAAAGAAPAAAPTTVNAEQDGGFGSVLRQGLEHVSGLEHAADRAATGFAAGDGTKVHEVMIAGAKSQIAVDLLSQLRNKAVEAYTEIMRLQV